MPRERAYVREEGHVVRRIGLGDEARLHESLMAALDAIRDAHLVTRGNVLVGEQLDLRSLEPPGRSGWVVLLLLLRPSRSILHRRFGHVVEQV